MKKIKNFFWSCLGFFFLSAALCGILDITFKQLVLYCVIGIAALFLFFLLIEILKSKKEKQKTAKPQPTPKINQQNIEYITITVDEPETSFSASIDKADYDYAYSHVGLFRPSGTLGPVPPVGTQVFFKEEPDNPYDAEAVKAVWYCNGEERLVGYFYRSDSTIREMARDWITRGDNYYSAITNTYDKPRLFIGFNRELVSLCSE